MTYAIFIREKTTDQTELDEYSRLAPATLNRHSVTPLAAYGPHDVLEGPSIEGAVILRFPSMREASAWYESPAYQEAREHRFKGAEYRVIFVKGLAEHSIEQQS